MKKHTWQRIDGEIRCKNCGVKITGKNIAALCSEEAALRREAALSRYDWYRLGSRGLHMSPDDIAAARPRGDLCRHR